ncbi:hypothetical protein [Herpetosiphon sp. NSE202]|uniref:hypothetical protein n=1 Tax=Herpetosiphon sp. NSE202 TaxID=3351349 RepID=UPI00363147C6
MPENLPALHVPSVQTFGERYGNGRLWWYMFVVLFVGVFFGMMAIVGINDLNDSVRLPVIWQLGMQRLSLVSIGLASLIFASFGWLMGWMLRKVAICRVRSVVLATLFGYWAAYILFNWPPSLLWLTNSPHTTYYRHMLSAMLVAIGCVAGPIALVMRPRRWAGIWLFSQLGLGFVIASITHWLVINDFDGFGLTFFLLAILVIYPLGLSWWFSYYLRRQIMPL